MSQVLVQLVI